VPSVHREKEGVGSPTDVSGWGQDLGWISREIRANATFSIITAARKIAGQTVATVKGVLVALTKSHIQVQQPVTLHMGHLWSRSQ
jgi:hypothetical protein